MKKLTKELLKLNLNALARVQPKLATYLAEQSAHVPAGCELEILATRSGDVSGKYAGVTLHSLHNPEEEAERLLAQAGNGMACYILQGFGMGYLAQVIAEREPRAHIIVIEPDPYLFIRILDCRDLTRLLSSRRVSYFFEVSQDSLADVLGSYSSAVIGIIRFRPLYERHSDFYREVDAFLTNHLTRIEVNQNTLARFGKLWVRNLTLNLPLFGRARPLSRLENRFSGIPGLLVGGGPSLDRILPVLSQLARRCLVVAVDTSFGACLRAGVEPDFVVVVDPQYWNTRHLDRCRSDDTILISESSTHPHVFRQLKGPLYFCSSLFPLGEYIEQQLGPLGKLGAGGSVSTSAWDFLRLVGCAPIYTAGIDLGFPDRQTHFRGSFFEERIHSIGARRAPAEHRLFRYLTDAGPFRVTDNSGGTVLSDKRMIIYRWWFERQAETYPLTPTRSLSPHGVKLTGIPLAQTDEILGHPDLRGQIERTLDEVRTEEAEESTTRPRSLRLAAAVEALIQDLGEIERIARQGKAIVASARQVASTGGNAVSFLDELNLVDDEISRSEHRNILGFLLQKDAQSIVDQAHRETTVGDVLESSDTIYRGLLESTEYHRRCLQQGLERLVSSTTS